MMVTIRMPNAPRPCKTTAVTSRRGTRIEKQLREEALAPYGLPLDLYDCVVERIWIGEGPFCEGGEVVYHDSLALQATFTHRSTKAEICITEIWADANGKVLQYGTQYGALTL